MLLSNQVHMVHPKKRKEINNYSKSHVDNEIIKKLKPMVLCKFN
jgi:hypothetical protein